MLETKHNNNESPSVSIRLAALFFLILNLAGCAGSGKASHAEADSLALRIGVLPTQECLRLFYAERMGITDSLDLRLMLYRSVADIDTALLGGSVDVALTDTVRLNHLAADSQMHVVAYAKDTLWLVATDSSGVRGAGGLKDKLVGMLRHSDAQTAARRLSEHGKYDEGDVFYIQVGDITLRYKMLAARLLDATFLPHPYSDAAIAQGHHRIKLAPTDTLCQGVWVASSSEAAERCKPLLDLLADTVAMQPDTIQSILREIYLLPTK